MVRVPLNVLEATNEKSKAERKYNTEKKPQPTWNSLLALVFVFCGLVNTAKMGAK